MRYCWSILIASLALAGSPSLAATPPPGGANQVNAVEGTLGQTLFNGEVRIRSGKLRNATSDELAQILPAEDKRVIVFTATMSNGTHGNFTGYFQYALVDADGVSAEAEERYVEPNPPPNVAQGAAWHQKVAFLVAKDFKPVKLLITQTIKSNRNGTAKAFRFTIAPSDLGQ